MLTVLCTGISLIYARSKSVFQYVFFIFFFVLSNLVIAADCHLPSEALRFFIDSPELIPLNDIEDMCINLIPVIL